MSSDSGIRTRTGAIFCDGACSGNGTSKAHGGWAWAYWSTLSSVRGEPLTWASDVLPQEPTPTNQRAELMALLNALQWSLQLCQSYDSTVIIYSDSKYAINCTSVWGAKWKRDGWTRSSSQKPLSNLDIIKPLVDLWPSVSSRVTLQHVPGHQTGSSPTVYGNNWVDRAAVAGEYHEAIPFSLLSLPLLPLSKIKKIHENENENEGQVDLRDFL